MPSHSSPLCQLAYIISQSVSRIDDAFDKAGLEYPSLDQSYVPGSPAEHLAMSSDLIEASKLIVAACAQLGATVKLPGLTLYDVVCGFHVSSALRVALESNTVEILRDHPRGMHAKEISRHNGVDPAKMARLLRLLSTHHVFREVSPDVFANNRLSSILDSGKDVDNIKADPTKKYAGSPGFGGLIEHCADEMFKGSAFMTEVLLDPNFGSSDSPEHSPMMVALKSSKSMWEWLEEPGNEHRFERFTAGVAGALKADPPGAILQGYKWGDLLAGSIIVDVGGGMGHNTIKIAREYHHLKYIIQDRPAVIEQAKKYWNDNFASAISDGFVKLQAHNFFSPQPVHDASVFICRMIVHDYGKGEATKILSHLRAAARPSTKLILIEQIAPYACSDDRTKEMGRDIPGAEQLEAPAPLLANLGKANSIVYLGDLQMLTGLNGEERTLGAFIELTKGAGWEIKEVIRVPGSMHSQIIAIPT